jgi:hypothetical protein
MPDSPNDLAVTLARRFRRHREMLGLAVAIIVLSLLMEVHADQRVAFRFLPNWPLPETCMSRGLFHISCPGCGMTRSFIYFARGDWSNSWRMHKLGWLLALSVLLQVPYRLVALWTGNSAPLGDFWPKLYGTMLVVLLLTVWLVQLVLRYVS